MTLTSRDEHSAVEAGAREQTAGELGTRLRKLRKSRNLSLGEVSEGAGISASFLSMVEKGQSDITVSRLMKLVHWFGVSIADLVQEPDTSKIQVVRASRRRSIRLVDEGISIQMLTSDGRHRMMPVINVYARGGGMEDSARHEGEEFVHVLSGRLELVVDGEVVTLEAGDSAYYRADVPHSFRNIGRGEARFLGVTTPPNL